MNKLNIGKRSNAKFASIIAGVAIGLGVLLVALGIVLFAFMFKNNENMVLRIIVLALGALIGGGIALFGVFQIFDININNKLGDIALVTYDEETKVVSFNDIDNGGELTRLNRADVVTIKGPDLFFLKRLYVVYKDGEKNRKISVGFTDDKHEDLLKEFENIHK